MPRKEESSSQEHEGTLERKEEYTKTEIKKEKTSERTFGTDEEDEKAGKNEINIPVFDEEDYSMWKKRIILYLKFKKCDELIKRGKLATDKEDWDEMDLKAMNHIYSAISIKQLEFVCEEETAYGIMKKLDSTYLKESTALQIQCRNRD